MNTKMATIAALAGTLLGGGIQAALADTTGAPAPPTPAAAATPAAPAAPAAPATVSLLFPSTSGALSVNPNPYSVDAGPLGKIYVSAIASGIGIAQDNTVPGDKDTRVDISNAQVIIQKLDGQFQFLVDIGAYSFPSLGTNYTPASVSHTFSNFFSVVPIAFAKYAPTDTFSIEGGKLPTLIGAEGIFTYQNINITRGLLWNLEPIVQKGVQANYTAGPVALSLQFSDGLYTDRYNWLAASAAWTINPTNTLSVVAGGNLGHTDYAPQFATALTLNDGEVANVIYTYNSAPWLITPYLQATHTEKRPEIGFLKDAWTYGAAVLANYTFTPTFSLGARAEYVGSTGSAAEGAPNVIGYGAGSKAYSLTVTPTFTFNRFYLRADAAYVKAASVQAGAGFGGTNTDSYQVRGVMEVGVLF